MGDCGKVTSVRPAVFFDRDGILNYAVVKDGKPYPPADADAMVLVDSAGTVLASLKARGYLLVCVTNQPDVARGIRSRENVLAMNQKVRDNLPLDDLLTCFHDNANACDCRKPKPGMLLNAARKWNIDLGQSWMVGDRASDVAAGRAAGCRTIFVNRHYSEKKPEPPADFVCTELNEILAIIFSRER